MRLGPNSEGELSISSLEIGSNRKHAGSAISATRAWAGKRSSDHSRVSVTLQLPGEHTVEIALAVALPVQVCGPHDESSAQVFA